jgi:small-conductance mechanosensitive channel
MPTRERSTVVNLLNEAWNANNSYDWGLAFAILTSIWLGLVTLRFAMNWALHAVVARTSPPQYLETAEKLLAATWIVLLLPIGLYTAASAIDLPPKLDRVVDAIVVVALMLQVALWINCLFATWIARLIEKRRSIDSEAVTILGLLGFAARVVVWTFTTLLILHHLNFNITALVAGLGVGGVAIALAVQNILGDLFASLSIVLDKPFVIGDFIVIGDCMGTVEHIGLKTTRLRSLGGELIVFSNADLLKSRIRNYKRMYERRVIFAINVKYKTPETKLNGVPQILREAVEAQKQVRFDRSHFKEFGEYSLIFEIVYYVLNPDFNIYMDIQQAINMFIYKRFAREKIEFAYPTRTMQLENNASPTEKLHLRIASDIP